MKIQKLKNIDATLLNQIKNRSLGSKKISKTVTSILKDIEKNKDEALMRETLKYISAKSIILKVSQHEIRSALKSATPKYVLALKQTIKNVYKVHKNQFNNLNQQTVTVQDGIKVGRKWRAIEKVGIYVPGGKATYPSSLIMVSVLAQIALCKEVIICTPPNDKGSIPNETLAAAGMLGIKNIYKIGGAAAIAALAYGTETVPKVYKIFGAGNTYVTEAKIQVFGKVAIDMPAGPSEIFIIADDSASPSFVAADLLADAEHSEDTSAILLTTSTKFAKQVLLEINKQLENLSTGKRIKKSLQKYGLIAIVSNTQEAINFCNEYAPEHLEIQTKNAKDIADKITNAGSIFLGNWTTKSAGDYVTGSNHILPTGGNAKMYSALSVEDFGRLIPIQEIESKKALFQLKNTIETFSDIECLPAHKNATRVRFESGTK